MSRTGTLCEDEPTYMEHKAIPNPTHRQASHFELMKGRQSCDFKELWTLMRQRRLQRRTGQSLRWLPHTSTTTEDEDEPSTPSTPLPSAMSIMSLSNLPLN
ncbi:hypothetical protein [Cyprinid herpesvirus 3]|uniref:Uncharacterized protein n=1 Tax=Cyprinid herpesvirus 3 TaxID=180230 RepID=A4FTB2_CYHV3|nr:hypothetical protein [Cyprinid herpesvirus 3]BAF48986.1 hypothetical protein [Cyprinid herpesvirus 3]